MTSPASIRSRRTSASRPLVALFAAALLAAGAIGSAAAAGVPPEVIRYGGADREITAVAISQGEFPDPAAVDTVFIATGGDYPDAVAGAAVAGKLGAPLLLVPRPHRTYRGALIGDAIPPETFTEIRRLEPDTIVILGGHQVVAFEADLQLAAEPFAPTVIRLAGLNRYETAVEISKYGFPSGASQVIVAASTGFADALAGGPAGVPWDAPVLLTDPNDLPGIVAAEIGRLAPDRIVVVGGPAAVGDTVLVQLQAIQPDTVRIWGADRYETAVAISQQAFPAGSPTAYVATGLDFPDALAGGAVAGWFGAPILLIPGTHVPAVVAAEIQRLGVVRIVILGGDSAITPAAAEQLGALIGL